jgi:SsrA-binding protein
MAKRPDTGEELIADNRKAGFDYHVLETFEAGLALLGTEVKAAREGRVNLRDSYCKLDRGEAWLLSAHFGQYSHTGDSVHDATRARKLLLHRIELNKLLGKTTERGLTIVPLRMYFKRGRIKVAIALAKGKKTYDKRETIRRRETDRETRAAIKGRRV